MDISGLAPSAAGTTAKTEGQKGSTQLADNFQTFLTLLTTQLQQQDPLDPLDTNEFTNQLVQFTQVEQSLKANQNLEQLVSAVTSDNFSNLVSYLGKDVTLDTNKTGLKDGTAKWNYGLDATADDVTLLVKDAGGKVVYKTSGETARGEHSFTWNGEDNLGNPLPDGSYSLSIDATTAGGNAVGSTVSVNGKVDGVETESGMHSLNVNGASVPVDTVIKVSEPPPENS